MANDRIMLLCRCGELRTLFKYYPGLAESPDTVEGWADKHVGTCHPTPHGPDLDGFQPFTLHTEDILKVAEHVNGVWRLVGGRKHVT